jgi:hypothetical protein
MVDRRAQPPAGTGDFQSRARNIDVGTVDPVCIYSSIPLSH